MLQLVMEKMSQRTKPPKVRHRGQNLLPDVGRPAAVGVSVFGRSFHSRIIRYHIWIPVRSTTTGTEHPYPESRGRQSISKYEYRVTIDATILDILSHSHVISALCFFSLSIVSGFMNMHIFKICLVTAVRNMHLYKICIVTIPQNMRICTHLQCTLLNCNLELIQL